MRNSNGKTRLIITNIEPVRHTVQILVILTRLLANGIKLDVASKFSISVMFISYETTVRSGSMLNELTKVKLILQSVMTARMKYIYNINLINIVKMDKSAFVNKAYIFQREDPFEYESVQINRMIISINSHI